MTVARLKTLDVADRKSDKARLNQLIDIISSDISTEDNRRKYPAFVSGKDTPVTSSLFNTIFDQDHTLQSSNALFDISFGVYAFTTTGNTPTIAGSSVVTGLNGTIDSSGKYNFSSTTSNMMREKINIYRQYAQSLLGNSNLVFRNSHNASTTDDTTKIQEALFINVKRLFKRDNIAKGTFAMKFYNRTGNNTQLTSNQTYALSGTLFTSPQEIEGFEGRSKLNLTDSSYTPNQQVTIVDTNASSQYSAEAVSGEVATLKMYLGDANTTPVNVGVIYYDMGVVVLDVNKIFDLNDNVQGVIDFPDTAANVQVNFALSGGINAPQSVTLAAGQKAIGHTTDTNTNLKKFLQLATIDDIIKHFCEARFINNSTTTMTFQNETIINSTIFFCRAAASDFNYSTNPSYTDTNGKIVVVKSTADQPFSYITTVGLYNNAGDLLAVAKLSRPIEKNPNNELTIRVRLDY
jgi:hypothetical protein